MSFFNDDHEEGDFMQKHVQAKKQVKKAIKAANNITLLRVLLIAVLLVGQLMLHFWMLKTLNDRMVYFLAASEVFGLVLAVAIVNDRSNPGYKIAWIVLILVLPIFGASIYLILGSGFMTRGTRRALARAENQVDEALTANPALLAAVEKENPAAAREMTYLQNTVCCPPYGGTRSEFLSPGEVKFSRMKEALMKAERFIFLEYFIIATGKMWQEVLDILIEKAKAGVEVRVMYDDFGSLMTLPAQNLQYLERQGIKCCVFGKLVPVWSVLINHRDHRKILVIDGKVGFTGGINLADEYINAYQKHGHWKDASVVLEGPAVWSLTAFFLSSWGYVNRVIEDFSPYRYPEALPELEADLALGVVQPYLDSPLDKEPVGENVYMNMITRAQKYLYLESPYLVIDHEMMTALCNAAKQGVDVRIVTPHIGDHWYVHALSRANYEELTEAGVRIYEYTPGFIHAKVCLCDDELAVVGTINLDYRSLFLHFEDAVLFYRTPLLADIKRDFFEILDVSQEITHEACVAAPWYRKLGRGLLKIFAPLM